MAVRYVSTTGGGNGSSPSSRWTIGQAKAGVASGDIVKIGPGYYAEPLNIGTSNTTWEAEDPANKPIFTGALGASTGSTRPPSLTGWNLLTGGVINYGNGTSGNAHPYVYRRSGFSSEVYGVWCNHPENTTTGVTNGAPTGYYHSLWRMHQDITWSHQGVPLNPDFRIHDCGEQTTGASAENDGGGPYKRHDWQSQAKWTSSGGTLDIRLHSTSDPNPNNYYIAVTTRGRGLEVRNRSSVTVRNLIFQHWLDNTIDAAPSFTMDGCECIQGANNAFEVGSGCHNSVIKNSKFMGGGAWMHHGHDVIYMWDPGSNNVIFENNTIAYGAHGGLTCVGKPNNGLIVRGNVFHHAGTLFSNQFSGDGMVIENNVFRDSGFVEDVWNLKSPHPAIELDGATNTVVRRNSIARCGWGMWFQANSGQLVQNVDVRHNTFADCQCPCMVIRGNAPANHSGNQIRRNVFYGPSGGQAFYRGDYVNPTAIFYSDGSAGLLAKYTMRENVWWPDGVDGITPLVTRGTDIGNQSTISGAGAANPAAFGSTATQQGPQANPSFVNRTATDPRVGLQLNSGSPAINIAPGTTISGESGNDAGAFEFGGAPPPTNQPPTVNLVANVTSGIAPLQVTFTANASDDVTAFSALQYSWNFGDSGAAGNTVSGTGGATAASGGTLDSPKFTYNNPGNYNASVTVTDGGGLPSNRTIGITVGTSAGGTEITSGMTVTSFGSGGVDQTGQTPDKLVDRSWSTNGGAAGVNNAARSNLAAAGQGWVVDIGRAVTLTRVLVSHYPGGGGTRNYNFTLATSPVGFTWTDIGTTNTTSQEFAEIAFAQRTNVRYIRLLVNSASDGFNVASFWELRAFEVATSNTPPTISLAATPTSGPATLAVNFTATSNDAETLPANRAYAWDFGDGGTSSGTGTAFATRSHNYTTVGNYICTVTVTDQGGLTASDTIPITVTATAVNNAPTVNLTPATASGTAPFMVNFNANASDPLNSDNSAGTPAGSLVYAWTFGDGQVSNGTGATFNTRSNTYAAAGVYTCQVIVSDNGSPIGPVKSTTKTATITVSGGAANTWPLLDAFDNLGTLPGAIFGPYETLKLKTPTDGDPAAQWIAQVAIQSGQTYIGWDLGASRVVKRLRFYFGKSINGRSYNYTPQYSLDKQTWATFVGLAGVASPVGVYFDERVLGTAVNARYIRILFNASANGCAAVHAVAFGDS